MIEFLCTVAGLFAGVAIHASVMQRQTDRNRFEAAEKDEDADRIHGIAEQLKVISGRVAENVNAHSEKVGNISGHISGQLSEQELTSESVVSSINEIIAANEAMQGQLADAQKRIVQQSEMIEYASKQARTDALTGLANRRALDEFLKGSLASQTDTDNEQVGLLMMDIDHFKNFNDSFGHTTGDAVLASFARSVVRICGQGCYAARFGGEEFAVILAGQSAEEIVENSAKIRYFVSEQVITYEDLQLKITSCAGLTLLRAEDTINSAYERADAGLYQAKKGGRNCGFWLDDEDWVPFPAMSGEPELLVDVQPLSANVPELEASTPEPDSGDADERLQPVSSSEEDELSGIERDTEAAIESLTQDMQSVSPVADEVEGIEAAGKTEESELATTSSEILDLASFMSRLDVYFDQLRRADLPASAIMIEAMGLEAGSPVDAGNAWETIVGLIQVRQRGIDVICQFRPRTLCIFLPGCAENSAIDRAAKVLEGFRSALDSWEGDLQPERLAVSLAQFDDVEKPASFLDRLERGLDEAADAPDGEIVVRSGEESRFQLV
ncbi:GGDEF domain-containing protein [Aureliella helgolandensis]|uniref:diguanylate cyclase n=1 Tax=Aureliella helgolandensis TaxID=2527968 RepID=A0A518GGD2_9BACT|nr:GGDEF domain-containing protein [Aureliella helgolandensis]QDV27655.1 Diguanylate cyclase YdeH [Aureliella helgolandensis]